MRASVTVGCGATATCDTAGENVHRYISVSATLLVLMKLDPACANLSRRH
eukprot:COSAG01_NODE_1585_length_9810_cov_8.980435_14_plen_50_part_00